ncbi:MAG TPA: hypothetical protein VMF69_11615 [Gemmataceae bacterium]|nr:hypothetical protein [Gemmataceae bacterium]
MKKADPTIQAVREARQRISAEVGHDPRKLVDYYRQLQERHRERLITSSTQRSESEEENAA